MPNTGVYRVTATAVYRWDHHRTTLPSRPLRRLLETDERARPNQFNVKLCPVRETVRRASVPPPTKSRHDTPISR